MPPQLSSTPIEFVVKPRMVGKRIDAYLSHRYPDYSRSVIQKVIDAEAVLINGLTTKPSAKVHQGDVIRVWLPELSDDPPIAEDIPLTIAYEDPAFVVVIKPAGLVTHPAKGNWTGTLVNALQFHFDTLSTVGGENRPGIVHRLDRDTSGLLIVAKENLAHAALARQFAERTIQKEYIALVYGAPDRDRDTIDQRIGPHPTNREKMAVRLEADGGKESVTFYEVLERFHGFALVRCRPKTGRTHQIRVHLTHIGHPILSDKMYSGRPHLTLGDLAGSNVADADRVIIARQALHAHALHLTHPLTGDPLDLTAPLPDDMAHALQMLRKYRT